MFILDSFYFTVLGALMLVHLLYDFHWQGEFIGVLKAKYDFLLFIHCLTYTLCIGAVLFFFGILTLPKLLFVFITHWVVDKWKCRHAVDGTQLTFSLWLDQLLHFLVLLAIIYGA